MYARVTPSLPCGNPNASRTDERPVQLTRTDGHVDNPVHKPRGKEVALWLNHKYVIWPPPNLMGDHLEHEVLGTFKSRLPLEGRNFERYMRYGKYQGSSG